MKDNNPSIADLSDPNRPERLAEQFREIYDNAWTDVLDIITENMEVTDEIAVKQIVQALQVENNTKVALINFDIIAEFKLPIMRQSHNKYSQLE